MWTHHQHTFEKILSILAVLLIVYTSYALSPLFTQVLSFISLVVYPFLLATILYYLLRPIVNLLRKKMSIYLAISLTFCMLIAFFVFIIVFFYPTIMEQIGLFVKLLSQKISTAASMESKLPYNSGVYIDELKKTATSYLININSIIIRKLVEVLQSATAFILIIFTVPFILFYLLKDDALIYNKIIEYTPKKYLLNIIDYLHEVDTILVSFINGRVLISIIISVLLFITFVIIGLNYPVLLFFSSLIFYIIPSIGAYIAVIPPLLVGFSISTFMGVEVLIIMIAVSILEGFFVTPKILAQSLDVHPITMIVILIAAGLLFGILGLILATPAYALVKVTVKHINRFLNEESKPVIKPSDSGIS